MRKINVHVVSDSFGETADVVSKAVLAQFPEIEYVFIRHGFMRSREAISNLVTSMKDKDAMIIFTLVVEDLHDHMLMECYKHGVKCFDIMGPVLKEMSEYYGKAPVKRPGRSEPLSEDYFKRIEAIEFSVKYDDGKDPRGVLKADITLIGVSRTSKTPLSMYLANRGYKVANIPLVPEVEAPDELYDVDPNRIFGLIADPSKLYSIREERLKALGLTSQNSTYAKIDRIKDELKRSQTLMDAIGCTVIDVSYRAIEETAAIIIEKMQERFPEKQEL